MEGAYRKGLAKKESRKTSVKTVACGNDVVWKRAGIAWMQAGMRGHPRIVGNEKGFTRTQGLGPANYSSG